MWHGGPHTPPAPTTLPPHLPPCFCSAEQAEFLRRKAQETRSYSAPVEVRCSTVSCTRLRGLLHTGAKCSLCLRLFLPLSPFFNLVHPPLTCSSSSHYSTLQTRGRSSVTRASARPSSRTPTPVSNSGVRSAMSSGASSSGLSAEQQAFLERKAREASDIGEGRAKAY